MNISAFLAFLAFNLLVVAFVWRKRKRMTTIEGYFLDNRSMNYLLVGSMLLLTNINAVQLIGENESVYLNNMSVMAWGVTSVIAMIIVSEFFMPIYLRGGFITIPDFLETRYDASTKQIVSFVFLFSYLLNMLPAVLYSGAVALNGLFNFSGFHGVDNWPMLWMLTSILGVVGVVYTIVGGIKVVAYTDVIMGFILFVIGISIPVLGLKHLGGGDFFVGYDLITSKHTEHLNAIGSAADAIPFSTIFTGMILMNLYYWGMEQFIVQRVLASKDLKESQKGLAFAAVGKVLYPLLFNIAGVIAVHLYPTMDNTAEVFPRLVGDVLPSALIGLTAVVVLGATISTFNAGLNSISALFVLNVYQPLQLKKKRDASAQTLLRVSKAVQIIAALIGVAIAPFIIFAKGGFYNYLQIVGGMFSVPIFTIIVVGFVTCKVPPVAVKVGLAFFTTTYLLTQTILDTGWHYLHVLAILFVTTVVLILLIGKMYPLQTPYTPTINKEIDLNPWRKRYWAYGVLLLLMGGMYVLFSPWGLAQ